MGIDKNLQILFFYYQYELLIQLIHLFNIAGIVKFKFYIQDEYIM